MYELEKTFYFEAGHVLTHHDGKCSNPHGHSYALTVKIRSNTLIQTGPKQNMLLDFSDLAAVVDPLVNDQLDHQWLNEIMGTDSPTAEYIAKWIYDYLEPKLPNLYAVVLQETSSSKVTYTRT